MTINGNLRFLQKALVFQDNKFLIIQRSQKDEKAPGKWDLPGGNIEWSENPYESIKREVLEETGLDIGTPKPIDVTSFLYKDLFAVAVIYKTQYINGKVTLSHEHQQYAWVNSEDYQNYDIQSWIKSRFIFLLNHLQS